MKGEIAKRDMEYETQCDVDALRRVAKMRTDKGRMGRARRMIEDQRKELARAGKET